jgi:hypothetical protein
VRPVRVFDERRVQRLHAAKSLGAEEARIFDAVGDGWLARSWNLARRGAVKASV